MKRLSYLFFVFLSLTFFSCKKETGVDSQEGFRSISLRLTQTQGYALEDPVGGAKVALESAHAIFTDIYGNITNRFELIRSGTPGPGEMLVPGYAGTISFPRIKMSSLQVYILGNLPSDIVVPDHGRIFDFLNQTKLNLASQAETAKAYIAGANIISGDPAIATTVNIRPLISRIEIKGLKASGNITGYKLTGIYVDRVHTESWLNGGGAGLLQNQNFDYNALTLPVYNSFPSLMDVDPAGLGTTTGLVTTPPTDKVWAYNFFGNTGTPRIVLRLESVIFTGGSFATPMFITIDHLQNSSGSPISMQSGMYYELNDTNLVFSEANLSSTPNLNPIYPSTGINVLPWTTEPVVPKLN